MPTRSRDGHGYESMLLVVLVVAAMLMIFIPAVHYGHIAVWTNIRDLYSTLAHPRNY